MSSQLSLPGIAAPAPATDRLFFALLPDEAAAQGIRRRARELRRKHGLGSRLSVPQQLHLSLQHLGNHVGFPTAWVDAARRAASRVDFPAFDLHLDRALTFTGRGRAARPPACVMMAAASDSLSRFHGSLGNAMRACGLGAQSPRFTPHVTMFYSAKVIDEHRVEPVRFRVREFVIVHRLIRTGQPYRLLGRWPLRD